MYEKQTHKHSYEVLGEYVSVGENLLGKTVSAVIEKVKCSGCEEDNIRLKNKYERI